MANNWATNLAGRADVARKWARSWRHIGIILDAGLAVFPVLHVKRAATILRIAFGLAHVEELSLGHRFSSD